MSVCEREQVGMPNGDQANERLFQKMELSIANRRLRAVESLKVGQKGLDNLSPGIITFPPPTQPSTKIDHRRLNSRFILRVYLALSKSLGSLSA